MRAKKRNLFFFEILGLVLALIWLSPFYLMLTNAFKSKKDIFKDVLGFPKEFNFENFTESFVRMDFLQALTNSIIITAASLALIIIFSSMAGYALARNKSKLSNFILLLFVASMIVPFQSVMIPLVSLFGSVDMLNQIGLVFMYLGFKSSLSIFLFHGGMTGISVSLDEAAIIDGANRWQTFWKIVFPLLKPITVTVAILNVMAIWNDYLLPSLVLSDAQETIPIKIFYFFGEFTKEWHLAMAGLTIAIIPVILGYFFMQKQIIAGVAEGAVK